MKNKYIFLLIFCNFSFCFAQKTLILQPDSTTGKDALLHGLASEADKNYGTSGQLASDSWTFNGDPGILRSVLAFDLSEIPQNAIVTNAKLSLFAWDSPDHSLGLHWNNDGTNASWLEKVTTPWDELTVTWNTQPATTTSNRISLPETTSETQNYPDIVVTQLVQDMVTNPSTSFGFMLKLQNEDGYRRMNFCSSDHPNKAMHPKLEISYSIPKNDSILILQPDSATGKDALLHGLASEADKNYGTTGQLASDSWTFNGIPGILRSVLAFDLSEIPQNAIVTSAKLSLYAWDSPDHSLGLHWNNDGTNASWLERVTSPWDELTVTWNTQPATTTANRVSLPETTSETQNYPDIVVTPLVQDMVTNPTTSFGFMLKLQNEDGYRRMNFCSSDHPNKAMHPKLEISYSIPKNDSLLILQPDSTTGKDALLHGLASEADKNYGTTGQLASDSWTFDGIPGILRSVVEFDLSKIPVNAVVTNAKLSLYAWDSPDHSLGLHWNNDGTNASWLERVTSPWDELTVTWNTQPATTTSNRISLPETTSETQNYPDINVTPLVQDMVANPLSSFGFMLKLQNEDGYRRMNFCSSDHPNKAMHPKLEISYSIPTDDTKNVISTIPKQIITQEISLSIYPNPVKDNLNIKISDIEFSGYATIILYNNLGLKVKQIAIDNVNTSINVSDLESGIYFFKISDKNNSILKTGKIIKN